MAGEAQKYPIDLKINNIFILAHKKCKPLRHFTFQLIFFSIRIYKNKNRRGERRRNKKKIKFNFNDSKARKRQIKRIFDPHSWNLSNRLKKKSLIEARREESREDDN